MKETGLMFKAPLVRAILSGQKTQTRRVFKQAVGPSLSVDIDDANPGVAELSWLYGDGPGHEVHESIKRVPCPFGKPGDRIYVRETFAWVPTACESDEIVFAADYQDGSDKAAGVRYIPSIHMPKAAARIWLEITGVRAERLQSISRGDAMAEGCPFPNLADDANPREWFAEVWKSTGGDWAANPWVWVIDFKRIDQPAPKEAP
ncbi:hypothetical protein ACCQ08_21670 [Comamonas sp. SY3]|uniref:hypothetical protein n=1 Tax=Comamonas sp. SY3 TaxID=3243601 RepID=UPI0035932AA0